MTVPGSAHHSDAVPSADAFEDLGSELTRAIDVLTSENFEDVEAVTAGLEPFVVRLEGLKDSRPEALDRASAIDVRRKLLSLNEVATHLHLVYRGLLGIGHVADGGYGPDGRIESSHSSNVRGEG